LTTPPKDEVVDFLSASSLCIGNEESGAPHSFYGRLYYLSFLNKALSPDEISDRESMISNMNDV
jgi:hypothetical protein